MSNNERLEALERRVSDLEALLESLRPAIAALDITTAGAALAVQRLAEFQGLRIRCRPTAPGEKGDFEIETITPAAGGLQ